MGLGLKQSLRTVHSLGFKEELYGFILQEAPTVRSAVGLKRRWPRSCLNGSVQSDDQLQREPENISDGRLLRHAQTLPRSSRCGRTPQTASATFSRYQHTTLRVSVPDFSRLLGGKCHAIFPTTFPPRRTEVLDVRFTMERPVYTTSSMTIPPKWLYGCQSWPGRLAPSHRTRGSERESRPNTY